MLTLTFHREPYWLDLLPGVRLFVRPATSLVFTAAGETLAWTPIDGLPSESVLRVAFVKAVARAAILDWEGIGNAAGEPIPPGPDAVDALLDLREPYLAFETKYVAPGLLVDQEKNVCSPGPSGISVAGGPTATAAEAPA